jgi:hypothetical protein
LRDSPTQRNGSNDNNVLGWVRGPLGFGGLASHDTSGDKPHKVVRARLSANGIGWAIVLLTPIQSQARGGATRAAHAVWCWSCRVGLSCVARAVSQRVVSHCAVPGRVVSHCAKPYCAVRARHTMALMRVVLCQAVRCGAVHGSECPGCVSLAVYIVSHRITSPHFASRTRLRRESRRAMQAQVEPCRVSPVVSRESCCALLLCRASRVQVVQAMLRRGRSVRYESRHELWRELCRPSVATTCELCRPSCVGQVVRCPAPGRVVLCAGRAGQVVVL